MPDAPPTVRHSPAASSDPLGPLTPAGVDAVLADFRNWLTSFAATDPVPSSTPPSVDLFTLVGQFTALRHEVNLQTKAARAATEQAAEAIKLATAPRPAADPDDAVRPLVKALVDVADALAVSLRQVEKARSAAESLLTPPPAPEPPPRPKFFDRLFGNVRLQAEPPPDTAVGDTLLPLLAGIADGYALSLRRVERALPAVGVDVIEVVGKPFDPEAMEAVEVVGAAGQPAGTVVEEVRRGYRWKGRPFRFALVKVAR